MTVEIGYVGLEILNVLLSYKVKLKCTKLM
jgi:hypothetical protein